MRYFVITECLALENEWRQVENISIKWLLKLQKWINRRKGFMYEFEGHRNRWKDQLQMQQAVIMCERDEDNWTERKLPTDWDILVQSCPALNFTFSLLSTNEVELPEKMVNAGRWNFIYENTLATSTKMETFYEKLWTQSSFIINSP